MNDLLQTEQNQTQWTLLSTVKIHLQIPNVTDTPHDDYKHHRPESGASVELLSDVPNEKNPTGDTDPTRCPYR